MTNKLKTIPEDAIKLVEFCAGYLGEDSTKILVESLWRTANGAYLINDSEGFILQSSPSNTIEWIDCVLNFESHYHYCCGDMDIHALREELMELLNAN
jgi:hypothetical protein